MGHHHRHVRHAAGQPRDARPARGAILLVVALIGGLFVTGTVSVQAAPATFLVNTALSDAGDANPGDDICDVTPPGPPIACTLRAAIQEANADADTDTIHFNIEAPNTISPASPLPIVTQPVVIDGATDPDSDRVELDGKNAGAGAAGLRINGGESTVRGLVVNNFDGLGIAVAGIAGGTTVEGNRIGTNPEGTVAEGNGSSGIGIGSDGNTIAGNLISGNGADGIFIVAAEQNRVAGNLIGTTVAGGPLGNLRDGVAIAQGSFNSVRPTATGVANRIAFNAGNGVRVSGSMSSGNLILSNSIESNGALGVDLGPAGVTPNDVGDADSGPNDLQNFPVLTTVTLTSVAGTLNSEPNGTYTIQAFASPAPDPSNHGEGATFLGSTEVSTDGAGNAAFTIGANVPPNSFVTTTATRFVFIFGSTSEFSAAVQAPAAPPPGPGTQPAPGCSNSNTGLGLLQLCGLAAPLSLINLGSNHQTAVVTGPPCSNSNTGLVLLQSCGLALPLSVLNLGSNTQYAAVP